MAFQAGGPGTAQDRGLEAVATPGRSRSGTRVRPWSKPQRKAARSSVLYSGQIVYHPAEPADPRQGFRHRPGAKPPTSSPPTSAPRWTGYSAHPALWLVKSSRGSLSRIKGAGSGEHAPPARCYTRRRPAHRNALANFLRRVRVSWNMGSEENRGWRASWLVGGPGGIRVH